VDDTPFVNDGADTSLRKAVSLLNKIEAKTGSGSGSASGTVSLDATSLAALENISVTFPATQNVNVTNSGLNVSVTNLPATQLVSGSISVSNFPGTQPVSGTFWPTTQPVSGSVSVSNFPATQPVSIANPPVTPVTDNGGSLTIDGSITATQATAASLKAQAQLLNAAGSVVDYAMTGTAGTPATDVVTVQGISGGTVIPVSLASVPSHAVTGPLTNTELRLSAVPVSLASVPSHAVTGSGSFTAAQATAANLNATVVGSGSFTAAQATASNLKAQAQLLNAAGTVVEYATTGSAGTPAADVVSVQGVAGGTAIPVSLASVPSHAVTGPLTNSELRATAVPVQISSYPVGSTASFSSFTSTSSLSFAAADATRKVLTVFNEGNGTLYIKPGGAAVSSTDYQIRMSPGDYWEVPVAQVGLQHLGVFVGTGTARITSIS
jgi:hypothetical protein